MSETTRQDFRLDGGSEGHGFIRVNAGVELGAWRLMVLLTQSKISPLFGKLNTAKPLTDQPSYQRHPGLSADEDDLLEVVRGKLGV